MASFNCRATPGSPRAGSLRGSSCRGAGARNLIDLAGDGIEPLVNIGNVARLPSRYRPLIAGAGKIGWRGFTDGGIEPVAQRHAGAARGGLGPFAHGWIDALYIPRHARIHAFVRSDSGACHAPSASPRVPRKRQSNSAQSVCLWGRLFRVTVNNPLRFGRRIWKVAGRQSRTTDRVRDRTARRQKCVAAEPGPKGRGRRSNSGNEQLLRCKISPK